jgi:exodeoxyribonuclease-3
MSENGNLRILCWNVNGIRAISKKNFPEWFAKESPDILCLQETKAHPSQIGDELKNFNGYKSWFFSAEKKGYSGVAVYSKHLPLRASAGFNNPEFDSEGRVLELEFEKFILFNAYFPNGGRGPERVKYKLDFYDALFKRAEALRKKQKNIIICGDYNTAHKEVDLARPKENQTTSGFLPEERAWIDKIVGMKYVDVFREYNKQPGMYTFWDAFTRARERNVGWRIDYFFVSEEAKPLVKNANIYMDVMGSDHCPIDIELKF